MPVIPVSAILPTRNRAPILARFLDSLALQEVLPAELVICDGSDDDETETLVNQQRNRFGSEVRWIYEKAVKTGLAPQRNQAVDAASQPFVWFLDDDVILEPACLKVLHGVAAADDRVGGVTATITNQSYSPPGPFVRRLLRWFENGRERETYASACVGPGYAFYPDASPDMPATMTAEWMIGCCTLYRKAALPRPAVPAHFEGGAIGEDLAASLHVAQNWKTLHARDARCLHDSQGGTHKRSQFKLAAQGLANRYWIMTHVLHKAGLRDRFDFALMHLFGLASLLRSPRGWPCFAPTLAGYALGAWRIATA